MDSLKFRQGEFDSVLDKFRKAKPVERIQLYVFACDTPEVDSVRGFYARSSLPEDWGSDHGIPQVPEELATIAGKRRLDTIRVGDFVHLAASTSGSGHLHLFNLGMSGQVTKLFPHDANSGRLIKRGCLYFLTPSKGFSPFMELAETFCEAGDAAAPNKVNGYPERLIAISTRGRQEIEPGDLHRDWKPFDGNYRSLARGWGVIENQQPPFWSLPSGEWEWGSLEVPVAPAV